MHFEAATRIECIGTDRAGELDSCAKSSWQPGSAGGGRFVRLESSFFVVVDQVVPQTGAGQTKETTHLTLEADDRLAHCLVGANTGELDRPSCRESETGTVHALAGVKAVAGVNKVAAVPADLMINVDSALL